MKWIKYYSIVTRISVYLISLMCIHSRVSLLSGNLLFCLTIFWTFTWTHCAYINLLNMIIPTTMSYFICSFCEMQAEKFNQDLIKIKKSYQTSINILSNNGQKLKSLISSHNQICLTVKYYNQFCSRYYFIAFITFIPISLLMTISAITVKSFIWSIIFIHVSILNWSFIFFISFMSARVTKSAHSSYKILSELQWHLNQDQLDFKIKLESTFERTIERKRIIGFSVLDLFTLNFFRRGWISILYARFSLIMYKFMDKSSFIL